MEKFEEALGKIEEYMLQNAGSVTSLNIDFTGNFNFPKRVIKWLHTDEGLLPSCSGNTTEKKAFRKLLKITTEYNLVQLVNKETREGH